MNKPIWVILLCLAFLFSGVTKAEAQTTAKDNDYRDLIIGSLGSGWVTAKDDEQLFNYLADYYSGTLLEKAYQDCRLAREVTTEWLEEVQVGEVLVVASGEEWEMVAADLTVIPGEILTGKGYFLIEGDPGRISWVAYLWKENDSL